MGDSGVIDASGNLVAHRIDATAVQFDVANRVEATEPLLAAVRTHLAAHGITERAIYNAELVVEEIFTNVVRYGYSDAEPHRIAIRLAASADAVDLEFDDDGSEFDPTKASAPLAPESLEQAQIGGLGIMLVRKISRSIAYRRSNGRNLLSMSIANR
jgi:serine/threonine-protein kinase RsbW